jgi:hypothetical protein
MLLLHLLMIHTTHRVLLWWHLLLSLLLGHLLGITLKTEEVSGLTNAARAVAVRGHFGSGRIAATAHFNPFIYHSWSNECVLLRLSWNKSICLLSFFNIFVSHESFVEIIID